MEKSNRIRSVMYSSPESTEKQDMVVNWEGEPLESELSNENMLRIVLQQGSDEDVNALAWKCLGYRYNPETKEWGNEACFPKWKERFPTPPDLIGVTRTYSKEVDDPVKKANQSLVRTLPGDDKQWVKPALKPLGWAGYMMEGLTPNKTRRAQVANWLIYYRETLFGVSLEELLRRKKEKSSAATPRMEQF
eukprot:CAMPEP_0113944342 /NCGR_PEP_ID=MMETSP1339-20121228/33519_1 /TAXON_ID=94617 /ORGANISM="Fibrocapsa japonica" /LENGTH=190 /DNA_ID=CAMNT_0000949517 /DNA_START=117 /DNA_END=689 /DNA_ORIENTATION=+ /assembly_acc=CAM_ASM_000762